MTQLFSLYEYQAKVEAHDKAEEMSRTATASQGSSKAIRRTIKDYRKQAGT